MRKRKRDPGSARGPAQAGTTRDMTHRSAA
jgi:hypothetical protein